MVYVAILLVMTMMGAVGGYLLKKLSESKTLIDTIKNKYLYLGGFTYLTASLLNIYILRFLDYSVVLPSTALTYIWTMLISSKFLGEKITYRKIIGTVLIIIGTIIIGLS